MRVISCHHGQGVSRGGELACLCHCPVQHHRLHQRLLGPATVVAVVDSATCTGNVAVTLFLVPLDGHLLPGPTSHLSPSHTARLELLIFHKEEEAVGVPAQDADGLFRHLHDGGVCGCVAVQLVPHVLGLKEAWGRRVQGPCRGCFVPLQTPPKNGGGGGGSIAIGAGSDAPTHKVAHRVFHRIQALLVPDVAGTLPARAEPVPMAHTLCQESHSLFP